MVPRKLESREASTEKKRDHFERDSVSEGEHGTLDLLWRGRYSLCDEVFEAN
jgi:hypothetical protein